MRWSSKFGLVAAGYVGSALVAVGAVAISIATMDGPTRDASSGMYAFGDSLLFLAVFGVASTLPTGAALYFLRPYRPFWSVLPVVALAVAATGLAALAIHAGAPAADGSSVAATWAPLAVLRILAAPLCALAFLLSGLFAPRRAPRIALFAAALIEAAVFSYLVLRWLLWARAP
jgi:hypothetical protein